MNRRFGVGLLVVVALLVGAIGISTLSFNAGVSQGVAQGIQLAAPDTARVPAPYNGGPYYYPRPFGLGFGIGGFLLTGLFIFLVLWLLGRLFWRGAMMRRWGAGGGPGHWNWDREGGNVPPMFAEWHRRAHQRDEGAQQNQQTETSKPQP